MTSSSNRRSLFSNDLTLIILDQLQYIGLLYLLPISFTHRAALGAICILPPPWIPSIQTNPSWNNLPSLIPHITGTLPLCNTLNRILNLNRNRSCLLHSTVIRSSTSLLLPAIICRLKGLPSHSGSFPPDLGIPLPLQAPRNSIIRILFKSQAAPLAIRRNHSPRTSFAVSAWTRDTPARSSSWKRHVALLRWQ